MTELNIVLLVLILLGVLFLVYLNLTGMKINNEIANDFDLKLQNLHDYNDVELDIDEELLNNNLLIPLVNNVANANNVPLNNANVNNVEPSNNELNAIINQELNQELNQALNNNNANNDLEELNSNNFINNSNTHAMLNNNN